MSEPRTPASEEVVISVERLMRFCYLATILHEQEDPRPSGLPIDLTRWGTLLFITSGFLYSLFDNDKQGINLVKVWSGFAHPFGEDLRAIAKQLKPIKPMLRWVRNRYVFHGSRSRKREAKGLELFAEPRAKELRAVIGRMLVLAGKMISWHMQQVGQGALSPNAAKLISES